MPEQISLVPVTSFKPEGSSQILAVGYDVRNSELILEFHPGKTTPGVRSVYRYSGVSPEVLDQFLKFPSIGSAFIHMIKKQPTLYPFTRLESEEIERAGCTHVPVGSFPGWWPLPVIERIDNTAVEAK